VDPAVHRPLNVAPEAPSSSEEGVGGGGLGHHAMRRRAAHLRNNPTAPESRLWQALRARRLAGHKFRRQAVIGGRIADFFCPAKGVIVEIDGITHDRRVDLARDADMVARFGYRTLRFTNEDVMRNLDGVLARLREVLDGLPDQWPDRSGRTTPQPPPLKRRGSTKHNREEAGSGVR